jgi:hypothetical protein
MALLFLHRRETSIFHCLSQNVGAVVMVTSVAWGFLAYLALPTYKRSGPAGETQEWVDESVDEAWEEEVGEEEMSEEEISEEMGEE